MRKPGLIIVSGLIAACGSGGGQGDDSGGLDATGTTMEPSTSSAGSSSGGSETTGTIKLDVAPEETTTGEEPVCEVVDDMSGVAPCGVEAPPDSFDPEIQWDWNGPNGEDQSIVTPLVANLTDDNRDGNIDLCDIPDVVVIAYQEVFQEPAHLFVLDGATGALHFATADQVSGENTPALGDIDGDGLPEIVAVAESSPWRIRAFEHDGTTKWTSTSPYMNGPIRMGAGLGLADLDNDGDVEIYADSFVMDHDGNTLWNAVPTASHHHATVAVDLDGDDDMELVRGHVAHHHDGSVYYQNGAVVPGFPQVADLDGDGEPEILVTNSNGISLLETDGSTVYLDQTPTGPPIDTLTWFRPAAVHDMDGDDQAEFAMSSEIFYSVYEADASVVWSSMVDDFSGIAAGTAFDFLGGGKAQAMYADQQLMFVFDDMGGTLLQIPRSSGTVSEYPVVADVDNDGSAEIVVVSNRSGVDEMTAPTVQVIRDVQDRWIPARRIWNQHTYHVTNVREDGTIPAVEPKHWELLNTFRTQAQIEAGGVCKPDPEG